MNTIDNLKNAALYINAIIELKKTADNLWIQGYPSTQFCRLLHNDYQVITNDDLNSPDDFSNLHREENKPMIELLSLLGYNFTQFGIQKNK